MSNEENYRPRSPDLPAFTNQPHPPPRLHRLPSYTIQEPSLPKGYSFSPRGSYDGSPFFSPVSQQPPGGSYFAAGFPATTPPFNPPSVPPHPSQSQSQPQPHSQSPSQLSYPSQSFAPAVTRTPPRLSTQVSSPSGLDASNQSSVAFLNHQSYQAFQSYSPQQAAEMARLRQRKPVNYNESHNGGAEYDDSQRYAAPSHPQPQPQPHPHPHQPTAHAGPFATHPGGQVVSSPLPMPPKLEAPVGARTLPKVDVRTKFPVARIKRIMQADEDVGKVAQATPSAVSKALELFMIALVTKGAFEAKSQNSKRVTATHLKSALLQDTQFDFLNDICESTPDEGSKKRSKSETKESDSEDDGHEGKKKAPPRRKKTGGEMDSD